MLKWIKSSQSEHPLADETAAREFIAELPPLDPYKSLEELCYWLSTLGAAEDLKPPRMLGIIDLIDQAANNHHRKLSQEYLTGSARLQKFQEIRIWNSVFNYWRQLADAYQLCLDRFQAGANGWAALKKQMPMVAARALRALTLQLKWQMLRYGPLEARIWAQMAKIIAYADEKEFADTSIVVYPGKFGESTVRREYLKAAMLGISSSDSLLPVKLEIAERIAAQFSEFFLMSRQPAKGCHYYVDLTENKPPARTLSRLQMTPGLRFFGPGSAAEQLGKLIATMQADGVMPSHINLAGTYDTEVVLDTLRHLARYWAPNPPARSAERRVCVSRISVVHDFDEIVSTVSGATQDLTFDSSVEVWTVENESERGYGALVPQATGDWLSVGVLLGIKLDDGASWGVGIVRRLLAYDHKKRYVGIQLLTKGASLVSIAPIGAPDGRELESALLLPSNADGTSSAGEMNLLLRPGVFSLQKGMQMRAYERSYVLVPRRLLESGHDFDMARFRVMPQTP
jgi:hypothetical protein